ncbi:hypothetical protein DES40_1721 [Litorimonas taeanensis]|uniref:Uncharacterized protein n=1 Tax=Litorimonas taeanensis TaxID=568099 RepID=A0A420WDB6_9PROT|nr:hypothetical protein [Litorimonas taeanensis]RKQ68945.1 hypothetical protein DES40_1721 [Litorimonas taeanensis]
MAYQTATGARAAFLAKLQTLEGLEAIAEDELDPSHLGEDDVFVTVQEGNDVLVETLIGATRPLYEVYSEASFDIVTLHKDKAKEAIIRARVIEAIETDPRLGDAVDDVLIIGATNDVEPEAGAEKSRATQITIQLHYTSTSPVG